MNAFSLSAALIAIALGLLGASLANAQTGASQNVYQVTGSTWVGVEDMNNSVGELGFGFRKDGVALMADRSTAKTNRPVYGKWQQNGAEVVVRFDNCVYTGRINGEVLSGTAYFFSNPQAQWNFVLKFAPPK
jgi:hypothetical protein